MKQFICNFEINNRIYDIYNVDRIEGKKTYIGETNYDDRTIFIENRNYDEMLLTLKHELVHIWLYEKGYKNQQDGCFSFEDICEIAALSNNFVNKIADRYDFIMKSIDYKRRYFED